MDTLGQDRGLNGEVGCKFTLPSVQKAVRNLLGQLFVPLRASETESQWVSKVKESAR